MSPERARLIFGDCSAPSHVEGCPGYAESEDHFTAKGIYRIWQRFGARMPKKIYKLYNQPGAKQNLSQKCHTAKDRSTPLRMAVLRFQLEGGFLNFDQHRAIFRAGCFDPQRYR